MTNENESEVSSQNEEAGEAGASKDSSEQTSSSDNTKMVPESQLIALRKKLKGENASLKKAHDTLYSEHLNLQSRLEKAESVAGEVETLRTSLNEANEKLYFSELHRASLQEASLKDKQEYITKAFGVSLDDIKDMPFDKLSELESHLKLVVKPKDDYAGAGVRSTPSGDGNVFDSNLHEALSIIEQAKKRK